MGIVSSRRAASKVTALPDTVHMPVDVFAACVEHYKPDGINPVIRVQFMRESDPSFKTLSLNWHPSAKHIDQYFQKGEYEKPTFIMGDIDVEVASQKSNYNGTRSVDGVMGVLYISARLDKEGRFFYCYAPTGDQ